MTAWKNQEYAIHFTPEALFLVGAAGDPLKQFYLMVQNIYGDPDNYPVPETARGLPNTPGIIGHQTRDIAWGHLGTAERMAALQALMRKAHDLAQTDLERRRVELFDLSVWQYMDKGSRRYRVKEALERGNRLYNEGLFNEAMTELAKVATEPLATPDEIARTHIQKGHVFNRGGGKDEALAEFRKAAVIADQNPRTLSDACRRVGEALVAQRRDDEAILWLDRVLELDAHPHHTSQARFMKGKFLYDKGDHADAVEEFQKVLQIPNAFVHNVAQAQLHIGQSLVKLGQPEKAIQAFDKVQDIEGGNPSHVETAKSEIEKARQMMAQ